MLYIYYIISILHISIYFDMNDILRDAFQKIVHV